MKYTSRNPNGINQITGSAVAVTVLNNDVAVFTTSSLELDGALTASSAVITGNVVVQGTASINTLVVNQTQLSTGSNQLGDAVDDVQTLFGTVRIPTGSLNVTGSTIISSSAATQLQVGNNLLFISSSGRVGIGTTTPSSPLEVIGNVQITNNGGLTFYNGNSIFASHYITTSNEVLTVTSNNTHGAWKFNGYYVSIPKNLAVGTTLTDFTFPSQTFLVSGSTVLRGNTVISGSATNSLIVRGSGTTSATTAFLVQNSAGSANAQIYDDGQWFIGTGNIRVTGEPGNFKFDTAAGNIANIGHYAINFQPLFYSTKVSISNIISITGSVFASGSQTINGNTIITGSLTVVTGSSVEFQVNQTGVKIGNGATDSHQITGSLAISSSAGTGSALTVYKSGSTVVSIQGSQGELFSITDSLSGSLFSVSNISGLPILEVFSDNTVLLGSYLDPMLITTQRLTANSGSTTIYSLPTASYDGVFVDYVIRSGSNARAGQIMGMWSGSTAAYTDNSTTDFGSTAGFTFGLIITGSNMVLTGSASTSGWTVRAGIRSI
jgi:hypothetical protein